MLFKRFRKKHGLYDLRKEVAAWVEKNIGAEYVEEALEKYDKLNSGIFFFTPNGNYIEWTGEYLYSDIPFEVEKPTVRYEVNIDG